MDNWDLSINPTDLIVILILLLSAIFAFVRGFVREVLSIAAWIGAIAITLIYFDEAKSYSDGYIEQDLVSGVVAGVTLFVVSLVILSVVSHFIAKGVRGSAMNAVDRSLGFLFGLARGALMLCLAYLMLAWAMPDEETWPRWLAEAQSRPLVAAGAEQLRGLLPEDMVAEGLRRADDVRTRIAPTVVGTPQPGARDQGDQTPADALDRDRLEQIIESEGGE